MLVHFHLTHILFFNHPLLHMSPDMCCSGLPTPDEKHARNIANFAIAVSECVHLVKSPSDGEPLQLRIGIHTGHCMGGVVGTLTPHYCLFGDMVNTTSRHESTGKGGKIQCSSVLYEHLAEYSADSEGPMYEFTPRGFVDMKGKGRCYTYWLDGGSVHNDLANPTAIEQLRKEVSVALSKKKWKKRKYFDFRRRRSSVFDGEDDTTDAVTVSTNISARLVDDEKSATSQSETTGLVSGGLVAGMVELGQKSESDLHPTTESNDGASTGVASGSNSDADGIDEKESLSDDSSGHDTVSFAELKKTEWVNIKWDPDLSRIELVASVHGLLSSMLWKCCACVSSEMPPNKNFLDREILRYVDRISSLYDAHPFHSFDHAAQVVLSAAHLVNEYNKAKQRLATPHDSNPFTRFITVFAALIHDVKHLGCPNAQLEKESHPLKIVYSQGSYQERQSIQVALGIFLEEFSELSTTIMKLCPDFLHLVTAAVLATDVANKETQAKIQERFERVLIIAYDDVTEFDKTQSCIEQLLLLADVGHCSQGYANFLIWNQAFFYECVQNHIKGHGDDPRPGWHAGQIGFLEGYILPLAERCNALIPQCELTKGTRRILRAWKKDGIVWTEDLVNRSYAAERLEKDRKTPTGRAVLISPEVKPDDHKQSKGRSGPRASIRKQVKKRFSLFSRKSSTQNNAIIEAEREAEGIDILPIDTIRANSA